MDEFTTAYIEVALWSTMDDDGNFLNQNYSIEDISQEIMDQIIADCKKFQSENNELLQDLDPEYCGHDFWLIRNRHGAGFWDRGLGDIGDKLTKSAHEYEEIDLYVGDNGKIYY